jgi:hypothetical protein
MSDSNSIIKLSDHFILYIPLKDKIIFEHELRKATIKFYLESQYTFRYHFYTTDVLKVDKIIIDNGIVASNDIISISDYSDEKKVMKIYLRAFVIIAIFILAIIIWEKL